MYVLSLNVGVQWAAVTLLIYTQVSLYRFYNSFDPVLTLKPQNSHGPEYQSNLYIWNDLAAHCGSPTKEYCVLCNGAQDCE